MASATLCDGSTVEYEPKFEDIECEECGHVTGQRETERPEFHGPIAKRDGKWFCSRCDEEFVGLAAANEIVRERILPAIEKAVLADSPFYLYVKGRGRSRG